MPRSVCRGWLYYYKLYLYNYNITIPKAMLRSTCSTIQKCRGGVLRTALIPLHGIIIQRSETKWTVVNGVNGIINAMDRQLRYVSRHETGTAAYGKAQLRSAQADKVAVHDTEEGHVIAEMQSHVDSCLHCLSGVADSFYVAIFIRGTKTSWTCRSSAWCLIHRKVM